MLIHVLPMPSLGGNAMTASVLSAAVFSLMTWALPTASGKPILKAPGPKPCLHEGEGQEDEDVGNVADDSSCSNAEPSSIAGQSSRSRSRHGG